MRLSVLVLVVAVVAAALPAAAQQVSPLGGTAGTAPGASTPALTSPGAAPGNGVAAQPRRPRMTMAKRFEAANTTRDGKLTLDQAQAANMVRVVRNFDAIDAHHNGYVTIEDIRAYNRARRAERHGSGQPSADTAPRP